MSPPRIFVRPVLSCARIRLLQNRPAPAARGEGPSGAGGDVPGAGAVCPPQKNQGPWLPLPLRPGASSEVVGAGGRVGVGEGTGPPAIAAGYLGWDRIGGVRATLRPPQTPPPWVPPCAQARAPRAPPETALSVLLSSWAISSPNKTKGKYLPRPLVFEQGERLHTEPSGWMRPPPTAPACRGVQRTGGGRGHPPKPPPRTWSRVSARGGRSGRRGCVLGAGFGDCPPPASTRTPWF